MLTLNVTASEPTQEVYAKRKVHSTMGKNGRYIFLSTTNTGVKQPHTEYVACNHRFNPQAYCINCRVVH